ncbi:MAG: hypothetical protein GYA56_11835 [Geobacteraceae bacterium]|nr:hypothetical protein [Geobacteraceae bacterium]
MAGKLREMLDRVISKKVRDNPLIGNVIKAKLVLKGIDPNRLTPQADNDPVLIAKFQEVMKELKEDFKM